MVKPQLIAFEGVDGAGKTTVLALVAEALRQRGQRVFLPRTGKEHDSVPTRMIRRLTRDAANFDLTPTAEMLLYCAREAQILEELVRPALNRGETVLIDRSLLTPVVLGAYGRQLDRQLCESSARAASLGLVPDATLIFDVHPRTSRLRKKLERIRKRPDDEAPGRKGLSGSRFKERIREGYLQVAREQVLPVFHAERATPMQVAARVLAYLDHGARPEQTESVNDSVPVWQVQPELSFEQGLSQVPLEVALFLSNGLLSARQLRARALHDEPELVTWGLDPEDPLLEAAAEVHPVHALRNLSKLPWQGERDLRLRLLEVAPEAALTALKFVQGEQADALRQSHSEAAPSAVLGSLTGRSDPFALDLRGRLWKNAKLAHRAAAITFCDDPDAWQRREALLESAPNAAIQTLRGLAGERVDTVLTNFSTRLPKAVVNALAGRTDPRAHELRRSLAEVGREVVESVRGLDDAGSWRLRRDFAERYPSTVIHSLEGTPESSQKREVRELCERLGAADLHTKRRSRGLDEYPSLPSWFRSRAALELES